MQDDCIAVALGLPQLKILGQKEVEKRSCQKVCKKVKRRQAPPSA